MIWRLGRSEVIRHYPHCVCPDDAHCYVRGGLPPPGPYTPEWPSYVVAAIILKAEFASGFSLPLGQRSGREQNEQNWPDPMGNGAQISGHKSTVHHTLGDLSDWCEVTSNDRLSLGQDADRALNAQRQARHVADCRDTAMDSQISAPLLGLADLGCPGSSL